MLLSSYVTDEGRDELSHGADQAGVERCRLAATGSKMFESLLDPWMAYAGLLLIGRELDGSLSLALTIVKARCATELKIQGSKAAPLRSYATVGKY